MEVWFNPGNKLDQIHTICVSCGEPGGSLEPVDQPIYTFSQAYAATGDFAAGYGPEAPGWPEVIASDFVEVTLPFIDEISGVDELLEALLTRRIPPDQGRKAPFGYFTTAYPLAVRFNRESIAEQILTQAEGPHDRETQHLIDRWSADFGIPLRPRPPRTMSEKLRGWVRAPR